ncbi:MAG: DUF2442 domain-containing protein [Micropepsaceae bacterium]
MGDTLSRLKSVKAMSGQKLKLVWRDGEARLCDLTGLIARSKALAPLADAAIFDKVKVIDWGAGVGWPNGLDLSAQTLRRISNEQEIFDARSFRDWQVSLELSNQEAADALGLTLGTIKNYRKGQSIPPAVAVACRAMMHDPHILAAHFRPRKPGRPLAAA